MQGNLGGILLCLFLAIARCFSDFFATNAHADFKDFFVVWSCGVENEICRHFTIMRLCELLECCFVVGIEIV